MFGKNEIVGRSFFKGNDRQLLVTSIFMTLQGEGPYQGRPAIFVRLAKCNLACSFCDTFFDRGDWMNIEDVARELLLQAVNKYGTSEKIGIVVTGGEPALQMNPLQSFLRLPALSKFQFMQIESNGTLWMDNLPDRVALVVSPKCVEADGVVRDYTKPTARVLSRALALKFVVSAEETSPYHKVPKWAKEWAYDTGGHVYVSPMNMYNRKPEKAGSDLADLATRSRDDEVISFWEPGLLDMKNNQRNHEYAARYALDNGFFLTLQQHLYASLA